VKAAERPTSEQLVKRIDAIDTATESMVAGGKANKKKSKPILRLEADREVQLLRMKRMPAVGLFKLSLLQLLLRLPRLASTQKLIQTTSISALPQVLRLQQPMEPVRINT
jgi:hypothetical protein